LNTESLIMALAAIFGFMASIYFIAGAITMSGKNIQMLFGTYWDYNRHIAKALSSQRAEYISGSIALGLSFVLQLPSALIPQSLLESHLLSLYNSICLIFLILLGTTYLSAFTNLSVNQLAKKCYYREE
jgi:hypothetical protein